MPTTIGMADTLEDVTANLTVLIRAELEVHHRIEGHPTPAPGCPVCDARRG